MQHRRIRRKLGIKTQHRKALLRNLASSLVMHKRIKTTLMKAKEASSFSDQLIEIAKRGDLHARRQLISKLGNSRIAAALIKDIAPHFKDRQGGYTRVLKLGHRPGDGSEMAFLEFSVPIETAKKPSKAKKKAKSTAKSAAEDVKQKPEKATKGKADVKADKEQAKDVDRKETEKRGGFLGKLRKFLKGDEDNS